MVTLKQKFPLTTDGEVDLETWLAEVKQDYQFEDIEPIKIACQLAKKMSKGLTTFYGQPCLEKGLEMAEIILDLKLDPKAAAAAIITGSIKQSKINSNFISEQLGTEVSKLVAGAQQMGAIHNFPTKQDKKRDQVQIDRLRKLLLSMVSDIRVVLIKLAERACVMRGIKKINSHERKRIAQETMDIYAPLANRLGIGHLKWELEDLSFRYMDPTTYNIIAKFLANRRSDREQHIQQIISQIKEKLAEVNIKAKVTGRAKHIYSIYLKKQRKNIDYENIFDYSAIRILVPTIMDCYTALSIVHQLWEHIPEEFDDYITSPKPNGYRSIHTAVKDPHGKSFEIQIRTQTMHDEAERGVAAHWIYKENKSPQSGYEAKIAFLRQLLDWHKEISNQDASTNPYNQVLEDRVYVFTPAGDILDLPIGSTPLDCAYHIHSEIGNRCRGAKINGHIVPLTYTLATGDRIEIMTAPNGTPSRDWLNTEFGYLKTPRARAKVAHWFRQQDLDQHIEHGRNIFEREFSKINIQKMATRFDFKDEDAFLAALGRGNLRASQITHALETEHSTNKHAIGPIPTKKFSSTAQGMTLSGITDLLTRIAKCCKPIPGDEIIGFITQGAGVAIHKKNCRNILSIHDAKLTRLLPIAWDAKHIGAYYVDIQIRAHNRESILKEITTIILNTKLTLVNLNSSINRNNLLFVALTLQVHELPQLKNILQQFQHIKGVIEAARV